MNQKLVFRLVVVPSVVAILGIAGWILLAESEPSSNLRHATSALSPPQALAAEHTFLHDHAGITAYARVQWQGGSPDWGNLKQRLEGVKNSGPGFIVGVLDGREGDGAEDDPHVLLQEDGWIAAYFPADQPAARILCHEIYGSGFTEDDCIGWASNALDSALDRIVDSTNAGILEVGYYHFGYPDATMLLAASRTDGDPMSVYVPSGVELLSVSISVDWVDATLVVLVDGTEVTTRAQQRVSYRERNTVVVDIPIERFEPDVYHSIDVRFVETREGFRFHDGYSVAIVARE